MEKSIVVHPTSFRVILMVLAVLLISGCASTSELTADAQDRALAAQQRVLSKPVCCTTLSEATYRPISSSRTAAAFGDGESPVYAFDSGKSYFHVFEIPEMGNDEVVLLRSEMMNGGRGSIATVFAPHVIFLGSDYKPVQNATEVPLCFFRGWTSKDVGYFGRLSSIPASAEYVVVFTDLSSIGESIPYSSAATTAAVGAVIEMQATYDFPKSAEGVVDIWIAQPEAIPKSLARNCWGP